MRARSRARAERGVGAASGHADGCRVYRALLCLWTEGYARSLVEPGGPWMGFAAATVTDWLALLEEVSGRDDGAGHDDCTLILAVLRGALLDLLATGDVDRTTAAVRRHLETLAM